MLPILLTLGITLGIMAYWRHETLKRFDECNRTIIKTRKEFAEFAAQICLNTYWRV